MKPKEFTADETAVYKFCQRFLEHCDNETISKYGGASKLYNIPFNYCIYYQLCSYEIGEGIVSNPENRQELEEYFAKLSKMEADMKKDLNDTLRKDDKNA